jgi:hypothetical protein
MPTAHTPGRRLTLTRAGRSPSKRSSDLLQCGGGRAERRRSCASRAGQFEYACRLLADETIQCVPLAFCGLKPSESEAPGAAPDLQAQSVSCRPSGGDATAQIGAIYCLCLGAATVVCSCSPACQLTRSHRRATATGAAAAAEAAASQAG